MSRSAEDEFSRAVDRAAERGGDYRAGFGAALRLAVRYLGVGDVDDGGADQIGSGLGSPFSGEWLDGFEAGVQAIDQLAPGGGGSAPELRRP